MKILKEKFYFLGSLVFLSLLSGVLWRTELEWRWGWAGLNWLSGYHYSIPLICFSFATWLYFGIPCETDQKRIARSLYAGFGGVLVSQLFSIAFALTYDPWETIWFEMVFDLLDISLPHVALTLLSHVALPLVCLIVPLSVCGVAAYFQSAFSRQNWWLVPVLFNVSFPVVILLLELIHHRGQHDLIHAVKSGLVFPGLFFSSGLAFLLEKEKQ